MQEIENNIEQTQEIKVGQFVSVMTNTSSVVMGFVTMIADYISNENVVKKIYRIRITDTMSIDLREDMIISIEVLKVFDINSREILQDFQENYGIECLDKDGNVKHIPTIINEVQVKDVWEKLTDEEKSNLVKNLFIGDSDVVDLINALNKSRKRNNELQKKVCGFLDDKNEVLKAIIDYRMNNEKLLSALPANLQWAYRYMYAFFEIDELLDKIN